MQRDLGRLVQMTEVTYLRSKQLITEHIISHTLAIQWDQSPTPHTMPFHIALYCIPA